MNLEQLLSHISRGGFSWVRVHSGTDQNAPVAFLSEDYEGDFTEAMREFFSAGSAREYLAVLRKKKMDGNSQREVPFSVVPAVRSISGAHDPISLLQQNFQVTSEKNLLEARVEVYTTQNADLRAQVAELQTKLIEAQQTRHSAQGMIDDTVQAALPALAGIFKKHLIPSDVSPVAGVEAKTDDPASEFASVIAESVGAEGVVRILQVFASQTKETLEKIVSLEDSKISQALSMINML